MTSIKKALCQFWGSFMVDGERVSVYGEDVISPEGVSFPYFIFRAEIPDVFVTLETSATAWFDATKSGANIRRSTLCDAIAKAIPIQGVKLPLSTEGFIVLHRSTGTFLTDYTPNDQDTVIGARVGFTITNYSTIL